MCPENTKMIIESNPLLFASGVPHFEVGDGWFQLLMSLCYELEAIIARNQIPLGVIQIKEKFGGLRFYVLPTSDEIEEIVRAHEVKSTRTCEVCGDEGAVRSKYGWLRSLCDIHAESDGSSDG
jgi:hypothetical protein